jgi:hypothetical protein
MHEFIAISDDSLARIVHGRFDSGTHPCRAAAKAGKAISPTMSQKRWVVGVGNPNPDAGVHWQLKAGTDRGVNRDRQEMCASHRRQGVVPTAEIRIIPHDEALAGSSPADSQWDSWHQIGCRNAGPTQVGSGWESRHRGHGVMVSMSRRCGFDSRCLH